ncbi:ABC transporter substrate-binding protein [Ensifer sp. 4252]|uniref:ABC transporter substrate-binding protein n=1 Tax=Ensifer sp. 4252 TaxID=3373915 RepID=UPI003D1A7D7C
MFIKFNLSACACAIWMVSALPGSAETLRIMSFGGTYQDAQRETVFKPFEEATGNSIVESSWFGELGKIRAMVEANNVTADVIMGDVAHALAGCDEGFLEAFEPALFGDPADYLPGTMSECGIPTEVISIVYAYNEDKIPLDWGSARPQSIADLFDTKKFPGKRALSSSVISGVIEKALLADGVAPDKVYEVLATEDGIRRVFAKLDTIKNDVVFYSSSAQAMQLLADGEVVMTQIANGRVYSAIKNDKKHFVPVWDGQVWYPDVWFVPKGGNKELAVEFLKFATQPKIMAELTKHMPYAPARNSAMDYVPQEIKPDLPTSHDISKGVRSDMVWWASHQNEFTTRFQNWMAQH